MIKVEKKGIRNTTLTIKVADEVGTPKEEEIPECNPDVEACEE